MKAKVTIRDVARAAGVSTKTVSRVANGEEAVAADTVRRVQAAIDELGYRANPMARSLRTGRDDAIAVVVTSIADPFFASVVDAVEEAARENGWFLLVGTTGRNAVEERAVLNAIIQRSVRGLVIVPAHLDYATAQLPIGPGGVPVVFVDRPPVNVAADVVMIDNAAIAGACAEHLIARGHQRIGFAATSAEAVGAGHYPVIMRLEGYRRALAAHGIVFDPALVISHERGTNDGEPLLADVLDLSDPPTAFLCANELASLAIVGALRRNGRSDVAVVCFDDFPMADALSPAVTVARQDPVLMGRKAFELLRNRIDGSTRRPRTVILPTTFIERGSGEISPPIVAAHNQARS